jgi:predicted Zn-dependent protease
VRSDAREAHFRPRIRPRGALARLDHCYAAAYAHPVRHASTDHESAMQILRSTPVRRVSRSVVLLLGVTALAVGCASDRQVRAQATDYHKELEPAILRDPQLVDYFDSLGERIVSAAQELHHEKYGPKSHFKEPADWMFTSEEFHLVNSETLNAFTTGGEHAYIYAQLMETCHNEDELAAVMAHEFGHVYARHVHKGMNRQMTLAGGALLLGAAGYAAGGEKHGKEYAAYGAGLGMIAGNFLNLGYTREDEAEADKIGFDIYTRAGWDPERFGGFFQQLIDQGHDKTPEMMSDHPSLASRVDAARKRAAALPESARSWRKPPVADAATFRQLQARAETVGKSAPSDESLARAKLLLAAIPSCLLPEDAPEQKRARSVLEQAYVDTHGGAPPPERRGAP